MTTNDQSDDGPAYLCCHEHDAAESEAGKEPEKADKYWNGIPEAMCGHCRGRQHGYVWDIIVVGL